MDTQNPYVASDAVAATPHRPFTGEIASKRRRFGTFLVDYAVYYLLCGIAAILVVLTLGEQAIEGNKAYLISIPMFFVYYVAFEGTIGRTPGKLIFGTRVVTNTGGEPSFGQAISRTLSRFITFEPLSVLFSTDGEAVGWHDSIARTKVARAR
ncbi:MAG TPA: RDD family protein [Lysobacter sp.]